MNNFNLRLPSLLLLLLIFNTSFKSEIGKKGCSGTYYISGKAFSSDKTILKNKTLKVIIGKETKTIETDSLGQYEIAVSWTNACRSGLTNEEHNRLNKKINPEYIHVHYLEKSVKLENKWKHYADCLPDSKQEVTWQKDLYF